MQGILFDKDGTLFDFNRTWASWSAELLGALAKGDHAVAVRLGQMIGYDVEASTFARTSPVIAGTPHEIAEILLPALPGLTLPDLVAQMNALAARVPLAEAAPLAPLLGQLRAGGHKIGLVTNDAEAPAHAHLSRAGVSDLFDFVAGCDSGFGAKPQAGQLLAFCAATGVAAADCVMVGDSLHDLEAGRRAGMRVVGVLTGIASRDELSPHADVVLPTIADLPAWLAGLRG